MERQELARPGEIATFEPLEGRLLLDGAPVAPLPVAPDGAAAPEAPQLVCAPPAAAGEPTEQTFNGRGIDLNEDPLGEQVAMAADADGDGKLGLADVKTSAAAGTEVEFKGPYVVDLLATADPGEVDARWPDGTGHMAYEPVWASGSCAYSVAPGQVDARWPDGSGPLKGGEDEGEIVILKPEFNPLEQPLADQTDHDEPTPVFLVPEHNPLTQIDGAAGAAKIMPVRVANPESAPADEPVGQTDAPQFTFGPGPGGKGALGALMG